MKRLLLIGAAAASLVLAGCEAPKPTAEVQTSRGSTTEVYDNGVIEGCHLLFVNPAYGSGYNLAICHRGSQTTTRVSCGKACTRDDTVITGEPE